MSLNPLGIGFSYYNNWLQDGGLVETEFVALSAELKVRDGILHWTMGVCGVGFWLSINLKR